ncbi:BamA/TamA family outer membrane protein [Mucilaginibacter ginkgonis]|uniref:BamA/TamA family outer membrane protein n=1 Tax=Mucilaginibacter ginkgonis TaxID=2682091 RepID=A0A6I4IPJ4_9SPHI|nr:BamA/TamA family outer membrane protein [Mucilaginibacter ginkgonis]QQL49082.1 BamA/TamA family outer membrane protein [Mucilaginibacter ginkgonis]
MGPYLRFFLFLLFTALSCVSVFAQKIKNDSITVAVAPEYDHVSKFHRQLFGENYRKLWATPVKMKVFYLEHEKGGLKVVDQGGGKQTRSLKLKDKAGNDWSLRTVQKYPERALPKNLRKTIVKDILQDEVSTSHPFSALVVPPLAEALSIPHSNPQIVYVADDPGLGKFRQEYANHVFLFEERDPLDVDKTDNTDKAEKKLEDDNDNRVDQKMVLRARLLDIVIGDWDRHEDQWRWDREKNDTGIVYTPIPRDRDKVFYTTSGIFPFVLSHQYLKSQLQPYTGDIRNIEAWNYNARFFDRYFLTQLSEKDWREQIAYVQNALTDDLIASAMRRMPANIYRLSAAPLIKAMEQRRNNLMHEGLKYYRFLADHVDIPATAKKEQFNIAEQDRGKVAVSIVKIKKDGTLGQSIYNRTFYPADTKEIRLYGMAGKDVFNVTGNIASPIKVRMIGGDGVDSFSVDKQLHNKANLYVYDRKDQQNFLPSRTDAKVRTSSDTIVNYFNRTAFKFDNFSPLVSANFNVDEGLTLIAGYLFEKQGFRQEPYRYRQSILGGYSFGRQSFLFNYYGDFKKIFGSNNDLYITAVSKGPNNVSNFFGVGNNTVFENEDPHDIKYYRNHFNTVSADARIYHTYNNWQLSGGITGQYYYSNADANASHFLATYAGQHPEEAVYNAKSFVGLIVGAKYDNRDKANNSTAGIYWNTTVNTVAGLTNSKNSYTQILTDFRTYFNPDRDSIFVIANRIGGGTTFGTAEFFQQLKLGGPDNLRGFHSYRFTGKTMLYDNLELRLKVFDFSSYLFPGSVGVIGFNDIGRVWVPNESSDSWHDGYGGGIYVVPAKLLIIEVVVGITHESVLPYLTFGFRF